MERVRHCLNGSAAGYGACEDDAGTLPDLPNLKHASRTGGGNEFESMNQAIKKSPIRMMGDFFAMC